MSSRETADARVTALALSAGRGDRRALEAFIAETQRDVWRFVAHLSDIGSADDLTQETYLRAIGSLPRFAGRSSARTWLLSIARRTAVDQVRTAMSRPRRSAEEDWQGAAERQGKSVTGGYEELVEVNVLLDALAPDRREALVLTQVLGYSYAEAAEILDCAVGTIRSRVARARDDLIAARDVGQSGLG